MSKEGERGTSPLGDSEGGVPGPSGVGQSDAGISIETPQVVGQSMVIDASALASILNQARGPILDRLRRHLSPFAGDGEVEISEWLVAYERLCVVEHVAPTDLLTYMLAGNAARVYSRMLVGEASNWEVVKAVLTAEYAMPRQEAWRKYVNCRLLVNETVDIYLGRLERLGGRVGLTLNDMAFRVKFYEGLPSSIYEWAVTHEQAYTADFGSVLTRVRDRIVSRRAVEGRAHSAAIAADSGNRKGSSSGCYRCGGEHCVKDCPTRRMSRGNAPKKASLKKKAACFRCGSTKHLVKDCPKPPPSAGALDRQDFPSEDGDRGGPSSAMELQDPMES